MAKSLTEITIIKTWQCGDLFLAAPMDSYMKSACYPLQNPLQTLLCFSHMMKKTVLKLPKSLSTFVSNMMDTLPVQGVNPSFQLIVLFVRLHYYTDSK